MTLVLPAGAPKKQSIGQRLSQGVGRGLEMGSQMIQEHESKKRLQEENDALKRMGIDAAGLSPELKKVALSEGLKGQRKGQEALRQQTFLEKLWGDKNLPGSSNEDSNQNKSTAGKHRKFTDEQIAEATVIDPSGHMAKVMRDSTDSAETEEREAKKSKRSEFESDREYNSKRSDKIIESAQEVLNKSQIRKGLINQQRRDIASGETAGILPYLADKTGLEFWRNPESARFKTASKQRFIENLSSIGGGARPNQFIEQQLVSAQAALGRDAESNQTVLDMEEFIDDLESHKAKIVTDLAKQDRDKYGYVRADVAERANDEMVDYAQQRQDEMAYDIRRRHEQNMDDQQLAQEIVGNRVTPDTPLTLRTARFLMIKNNDDEKKAFAEAKRLGYRIPTEETYRRG